MKKNFAKICFVISAMLLAGCKGGEETSVSQQSHDTHSSSQSESTQTSSTSVSEQVISDSEQSYTEEISFDSSEYESLSDTEISEDTSESEEDISLSSEERSEDISLSYDESGGEETSGSGEDISVSYEESSEEESSEESSEEQSIYTPLNELTEPGQEYLVKTTIHGSYDDYNYYFLDDGQTIIPIIKQGGGEDINGVVAARISLEQYSEGGKIYYYLQEIVEEFPDEEETNSFAGLEISTAKPSGFTPIHLQGRSSHEGYTFNYFDLNGEKLPAFFQDVPTKPRDTMYLDIEGYYYENYLYVVNYEQSDVVSDLHFLTEETSITLAAVNSSIKLDYEFTSVYPFNKLNKKVESSDKDVVSVYHADDLQRINISGKAIGTAIITLKVGNAEISIDVTVEKDAVTDVNFSLSTTSTTLGRVVTPNVTILPETAPQGYTLISSNTEVAVISDNKIIAVGSGTTSISIKTEFEEKGGSLPYDKKPQPISLTVGGYYSNYTFDELFALRGNNFLVVFNGEFYQENGGYAIYEPNSDRHIPVVEESPFTEIQNTYFPVDTATYNTDTGEYDYIDSLLDGNPSNYENKLVRMMGILSNDGENISIERIIFASYTKEGIAAKFSITDNLAELGLPAQDAKVTNTPKIGETATMSIETVEAGVTKVEVDNGSGEPLDITSTLSFTAGRFNNITITYFDRHLTSEEKAYNSGSGFKNRSGALAKDYINYTLSDGCRAESVGVYYSGSNIMFEFNKSAFYEGYNYKPWVRIYLPSNYRLIGADIDFSTTYKDYWSLGYGSGTNNSNYKPIGSIDFVSSSTHKQSDGYYHFLEGNGITKGNVLTIGTRDINGNWPGTLSITYIKILYTVIPE